MITLKDALDYEIRASAWWTSFVFWDWGQNCAASYFLWKAKRKFARYQFWTREIDR